MNAYHFHWALIFIHFNGALFYFLALFNWWGFVRWMQYSTDMKLSNMFAVHFTLLYSMYVCVCDGISLEKTLNLSFKWKKKYIQNCSKYKVQPKHNRMGKSVYCRHSQMIPRIKGGKQCEARDTHTQKLNTIQFIFIFWSPHRSRFGDAIFFPLLFGTRSLYTHTHTPKYETIKYNRCGLYDISHIPGCIKPVSFTYFSCWSHWFS